MDIQRDEAFEDAYSKICKPIIARPYPRDANGEYVYKEIHEAKLMWQEAKNQVPESNALLSASLDAIQKLGSGDFVLVPRVISDEWMATHVNQVIGNYCKDYEDLPFAVDESELPELKENFRLTIRSAHKRLMKVIEAQEQSHD